MGCSGTGSSPLWTESPARSGELEIRGSGATSLTFASYAEAPKLGGRISPVRITLPDGEVASNDRADLERILSRAFGRDIAFVEARAEQMTSGVAEEYWPDMAGLEHRDTVTDFEMPAGTFFDEAVRLANTEPCPSCVMITLPQGDLPKDSGILRTAAQHNAVNVGVYASVVNGGTIRRGDAVVFA